MQIKNKLFNKKYELIEKIGKGGMGEIYKYRLKENGKICAVKFIKKEKASEKNIEKFKKEIIALTKILNQHFMSIIDYYFSKNLKCIVYEYIEGENLGVKIFDRGFIPLKESYSYMIQIVKALNYMHKEGILHRDIKPQNIIIKSNGNVVICDFGLAITKEGLDLVNSNTIEGTIHYISPEVLRGFEHNEQSDIFSSGILFFQMLFGHPPFFSLEKNSSLRNSEVRHKILNASLPNMNNYDNIIPNAMQNVLIKAIAKLPRERYKTFQDFYNDLKNALNPKRSDEKIIKLNMKFTQTEFMKKEYQEISFWSQSKKLPWGYWVGLGLFFIFLIGVFIWLKD